MIFVINTQTNAKSVNAWIPESLFAASAQLFEIQYLNHLKYLNWNIEKHIFFKRQSMKGG